jgi:HSP20 family protein
MMMRWNDLGWGELDRSFAALSGFRDEMERVFQRFEQDWAVDGAALDSAQPAIQLRDAGDDFQLVAEVPGFAPEDLHVSLEQSTLTLRGQRNDDLPEGYGVHRRERSALQFARAFTLPARVDGEKIEASIKDGVLSLRLPKLAEERRRTISVTAS